MGGGLHRAIVESANLRIGDSLICCTGATPLSAPGTAPTSGCGPFPSFHAARHRCLQPLSSRVAHASFPASPALQGSSAPLFLSGRLFWTPLFLALFCPQFLREVASMQTAYSERRAAHTCESIIDGSLTLDLHPSVAKENTDEISNHVRGMAKGKEQDGTGAGFEMGMPRHKTTPGNA